MGAGESGGIIAAIITRMRFSTFFFLSAAFLGTGFAAPRTVAATHHSLSGAAVIREMNLARQHPDTYANYIAQMRDHFRGSILVLPGGTLMRTHEGVAAIDEAIHFLRTACPLPPFVASPGMSLAAADHVSDQAKGDFGHDGSDRSDPAERLNRHGVWSGRWGENSSYGKSSARDIVIALIVDDGQRARKHRKNIFNEAFNYAGAAVGPHARYRTVCSIDFAAGYAERGALPGDSLLAKN
jgi:hypothetical protein